MGWKWKELNKYNYKSRSENTCHFNRLWVQKTCIATNIDKKWVILNDNVHGSTSRPNYYIEHFHINIYIYSIYQYSILIQWSSHAVKFFNSRMHNLSY